MSLLRLPNEIILYIAHHIGSPYNLTLVNRKFYRLLHHTLYRYNVKYRGSSAIPWAAKKGDLIMMKRLLAEGAPISRLAFNINAQNLLNVYYSLHSQASPASRTPVAEDSPLDLAVREDNEEMVEFLLTELAKNSETSAMLAIQVNETLAAAATHGQNRIVLRMLGRGADIDFRRTRGIKTWTPPLALAASNGNLETVKLLLEHGADVKAGNRTQSALGAAIRKNQTEIARLLFENGADPNSIYLDGLVPAAERGDTEMVELLLNMGPQFRRSFYCQRALFKAIEEGHEKVTRLLIEQGGADPKLLEPTNSRSTMRMAVRQMQPNLGIVRLLIEQGVLPDSQDLRLVKFNGNEELIGLLEQYCELP